LKATSLVQLVLLSKKRRAWRSPYSPSPLRKLKMHQQPDLEQVMQPSAIASWLIPFHPSEQPHERTHRGV